MKKIPDTETRVAEHSPQSSNECIHRDLVSRIFYYAQNSALIDDRLAELDQEWDIERMLQTNAAGISLFGILMASRNRKWLLLPLTIAGFLLQHAIQGWCPPIEIFRRIGVRTTQEINSERYALKALRGDFDDVDISAIEDAAQKVEIVLNAVEKNNLK